MESVFSHIVQTRLSQESENVATMALAFILGSSEKARTGLLKLLRGIDPQMPNLWFRTQQTEESNRPDMWGYDEQGHPHLFIENKFWAGLTDNQPVGYLQSLAGHASPTVLLMVAPEAREETLWRELTQRLVAHGITMTDQTTSTIVGRCVGTSIGPVLALTSWERILSALEAEVADELATKSNLFQLRSLCQAADHDAFTPFSSEYLSDQQAPAFMVQLTSVIQTSIEKAISQGVLTLKKLGSAWIAKTDKLGRYANRSGKVNAGIWFGIHFELWKRFGVTPLWVVFSHTDWGRGHEVRAILEPWASQANVFTVTHDDGFAVAINVPVGQEQDSVVRSVVDQIRKIVEQLSALPPGIDEGAPELNSDAL
jgi:hypothetical protein